MSGKAAPVSLHQSKPWCYSSLARHFHEGKSRRLGEKLSIQARRFARSRAAAGLLLLALTAHAFVAGATHFHRIVQPGASHAQTAVRGGEERGQEAPLTGDERQCLLCRLQRNLVSDLRHSALVIAPPPASTPVHGHLQEAAARAATLRLRQGRAPPSDQS